MTTGSKPEDDWTLVLRRQPTRIVEGQPEGGYTDVFELICCYCGDHPALDYREIPPKLQLVRGHTQSRPVLQHTSNTAGCTSSPRRHPGRGRLQGQQRTAQRPSHALQYRAPGKERLMSAGDR
jgi:hypothetical protein